MDADQLPGVLAVKFEELFADLRYGADTMGEALALMSAGDRVRLAERMVSLYGELCRHLPVGE